MDVTFTSLAINSTHLCTRAEHSESFWVVLMSVSRIIRLIEIWHYILTRHILLWKTNCFTLSMLPYPLISGWLQLMEKSCRGVWGLWASISKAQSWLCFLSMLFSFFHAVLTTWLPFCVLLITSFCCYYPWSSCGLYNPTHNSNRSLLKTVPHLYDLNNK